LQETPSPPALYLTSSICFCQRSLHFFCTAIPPAIIIPAEATLKMTTDPRYPIGKFSFHGVLTADQRKSMLDDIEQTPARVRAAVRGLSDQQLNTPYREGGWTVRQLAHHVPDSHMNAYIRFKLALTEDEPTIRPYMEDRWAELPESKQAPIEVSLALLENLHQRWTLVLKNISDADWKRTFRHPEMGLLSLEKTLALYSWHGRHHTAQVTALRDKMGW
jgi:uncharacterized damage-inducible protein DinB